jgi:hypothetical protein
VHWRTSLRNGRTLAAAAACGAAPANPSSISVDIETSGSSYYADLRWGASTDDSSTGSVTHYVVLMRPNSNPVVWQQLAIVPARGTSTYRYDHHRPELMGSVRFGVLAVGCGGVGSGVRQTNPQNIP